MRPGGSRRPRIILGTVTYLLTPSRWIPCILLGWGVGGAYWSLFNVRPPGEASAPWRFI